MVLNFLILIGNFLILFLCQFKLMTYMKKVAFVLSFLTCMLCATASQSAVPFIKHKKGSSQSGTVHRAPVRINIDGSYDDVERTVTLIGEYENEVEVMLYSPSGEVVDYATCLNVTLSLPENAHGDYTIMIESESWYATGMVRVE